MRPEVTALLEEDDRARQILACWPAAVGEWERRKRAGDVLEVWAEVAGVDILVILETGMKLLRCGAALDNREQLDGVLKFSCREAVVGRVFAQDGV